MLLKLLLFFGKQIFNRIGGGGGGGGFTINDLKVKKIIERLEVHHAQNILLIFGNNAPTAKNRVGQLTIYSFPTLRNLDPPLATTTQFYA